MAHVRTALDTARTRRDLVIVLGLDPESPEAEYGWIEPTVPIIGHSRVLGVCRFWEKPNPLLAQVLQLRGCLWRHCSPPINKFSTWKTFREAYFPRQKIPEIPGNKKGLHGKV
jgi:hypothetical protein